MKRIWRRILEKALMKYMMVICLLFILPACQNLHTSPQLQNDPTQIANPEEASHLIQEELSQPYISPYGPITMDDHKRVDKWVDYFQTKRRELMEEYLSRSTRYIPMMKKIFRDYQLPEDLVYVAMIESGFSPRARSFANAVGYWQFIASTARRYGLKVNSYVDERRDPILSTRAAAEYFKDLYGIFGSWHLALASYNAGEYRVNRFVMRHYTRDFWHLSSRRFFPSETANYVPKFIAAARIGKDPTKYGFNNIMYEKPMEFDKISLRFSISLKKLAKRLNVNYRTIQDLNPRYQGAYVPLEKDKETVIRIPKGMHKQARSVIAYCKTKKPRYMYADYYWYRIRRGDSLYRLARKNRTTVAAIRRLNRMSSHSTILRVGRKIKLPYYSRTRRSEKGKIASTHLVKKGDNLHSIARKYRVRVSNLKKINNIANTNIYPGQVLRLVHYPKQKKGAIFASNFKNKKLHVVRRGDTLIGIAKRYNVSLPTLMRANAMNFKSILTVGKYIVIPK